MGQGRERHHYCICMFLAILMFTQAIGIKWRHFDVPSSVNRGSDTVLTCQYDLQGDLLYSVKWYKAGREFYRYIPDERPIKQKFPLAGVSVNLPESDDQTVSLLNVGLQTAGQYCCEVLTEAPKYSTLVKSGRLVVVDLPKDGPTVSGGQNEYRPGDKIDVNCSAPKSVPAPTLTWYINDDQAPHEYLVEYPSEEDDSGRIGATLGLHFTVRRWHFFEGQLTLRCTATVHRLYEEHALHTGAAVHSIPEELEYGTHLGDGAVSQESSLPSLLLISSSLFFVVVHRVVP
ncbi:cell adhesion molecule 2-like [Oratosquilla oratoria]|uniref:cell adhesion molecule 2-like n=1 Tax=Oratosquilla oratoria TaxID=337810 RepID=UPI003F76DB4B